MEKFCGTVAAVESIVKEGEGGRDGVVNAAVGSSLVSRCMELGFGMRPAKTSAGVFVSSVRVISLCWLRLGIIKSSFVSRD